MIYANYSQGYKAGGYNSRGTIPENVGPYEPERVTAYEVGLKSDLFDRLLRFNVAGFVNKYSDLQSSVTKMGAVRPENITTHVAAEIGRAHVRNPVTNAHLVSRLLIQ